MKNILMFAVIGFATSLSAYAETCTELSVSKYTCEAVGNGMIYVVRENQTVLDHGGEHCVSKTIASYGNRRALCESIAERLNNGLL